MRQKQIFEKILVELHQMRIALEMLVPDNTVLLPDKPKITSKQRKGWSKAEENRLIVEINAGRTFRELEVIFGRTRAAIQSRASDLRRQGIKIKKIKGQYK